MKFADLESGMVEVERKLRRNKNRRERERKGQPAAEENDSQKTLALEAR